MKNLTKVKTSLGLMLTVCFVLSCADTSLDDDPVVVVIDEQGSDPPKHSTMCDDGEFFDEGIARCVIGGNEMLDSSITLEDEPEFYPASGSSSAAGVDLSECANPSQPTRDETVSVDVCVRVYNETTPLVESTDYNEDDVRSVFTMMKEYFEVPQTGIDLKLVHVDIENVSTKNKYNPSPDKVHDLVKITKNYFEDRNNPCDVYMVLTPFIDDPDTVGKALFPYDPKSRKASDGVHGFVTKFGGHTSIQVAGISAHEMGHVLGARHVHDAADIRCTDYDHQWCMPNNMDPSRCCGSDGYESVSRNVMSYCAPFFANNLSFSPCQTAKMQCFVKKAFNSGSCVVGEKRCKSPGEVEKCVGGVWKEDSSCAMGFVCQSGQCVDENACNQPGQIVSSEPIGSCGGFSNSCDESGTQPMSITKCSFRGVLESYVEDRGCNRDTDGQSCPQGTCVGGICEQTRECQGEGITSYGDYGDCIYDGHPQCGETGTKTRVNTACRNGSIQYENDSTACRRTTNGIIVNDGNWNTCSYATTCAETATPRSRQRDVCRNGQLTTVVDTQPCTRNTDGDSCGSQRECSNGACNSTCSSNDFWSPPSSQALSSTINGVRMGIQIAQGVNNGAPSNSLFARACKNSGNIQNDMHLIFAEDDKYPQGVMLFNGTLPRTSPSSSCTEWVQLGYTSNWSSGEKMGGFVRLVSPVSQASSCNTTCSNSCGFCWNFDYNDITRTCRQ